MLILRRVPRRGGRLSAGLAAAETTIAFGIAHTAAGGEVPSAGWLVAIAVMSYGVGRLVLGGRAPIRVAVPALVTLQVLLHAWLVTLTAGHEAGAAHGAESGALLGLTWPMMLAHLTAGVAATLAWALRRRAVDVLLSWAESSSPLVPHLRNRPAPAAPQLRSRSTLLVAPTRGPPAAQLAAT